MLNIFLSFIAVVLLTVLSVLLLWVVSFLQLQWGQVPIEASAQPIKNKSKIREAAMIRCKGFGPEIAKEKYLYDGLSSCKLAHHTAGGFKECATGCLSLGDCVRVCDCDALTMNDYAPVVDLSKCSACGQCVEACPRDIIKMGPLQPQYMVSCVSHQRGAATRQDCSVGCIACEKCLTVCEYGAIIIDDFLAVIDPLKCVACGACAKICPRHIIDYVDSTVAIDSSKLGSSRGVGCADCGI